MKSVLVSCKHMEDWEERFLRGDHADDAAAVSALRSEMQRDDEPLLFGAVSRVATLEFLEKNGVDLLQRAQDGSTLLMDNLDRLDLAAYRWLAGRFRDRGAIDWAEETGVTPLAGKIRFGQLAKARILLEHGASVESFATLPRYGGQSLDVATQAVLCSPLEGDAEPAAIEALELLKSFGLEPSADQKAHMLSRVSAGKDALRNWIEANL